MTAPKIVSVANDFPYRLALFLWAILFAPLSLGVFVFTSSHFTPLALPGILIVWAVMVGNMTDEDPDKINWKKRFFHWIAFPIVATLVQALIFGSSLWLSVVFLNAWFMMSRAWAAFGMLLWDAADRKNWKEFRSILWTFIGGAPVLMLLYLPVTFTVLMSIVDSTSRIAGENELLKKNLLALAILGLLVDIVLQSRPFHLRGEALSK